MARKRKSRVAEAPQEPELVQPAEPAPEPEPEPEPESQQPQTEDTVQTLEGNLEIGDEVVVSEKGREEKGDEVVEGEKEEEEPRVEEGEGEEDPQDDIEVHKNDGGAADQENTEQRSEPTVNLSLEAVSESGDEAEEQNAVDEDELEEEPLEKLLEPFSKDQLALLFKEAVAKHPDVMEIVHKLASADPAHCKIFVHGLGWDANAEMITSVFGKYGEIEDCKVVRDKNTGKSKGYGFILYKNRNGARRALKEPQKMINGRMTSCQLATAGPVQTPPQTAVAAVPTPHMSEHTQRKIFVSNVSAELDTNKLLEFFSKFGEIEEGPLGLDKQTGKPRGFCLFVYKTFEGAKKALEEPHKNFEGHILHCQKAIDGPKYSKNYFNQQPGQPQQHHHHHQGYYNHPAKKAKYAGNSGGGHTGGHLMAPSAGPAVPSVGLNPAVAPAAIGQAVAALLATQGPAGLGIGNLVGGIGAGMNPQGVPPMMTNAGYGGQGGAGGFAGQPTMHGGYGGQMQTGQGGVRPHQGGPPYMGRGR